ncbi:MAG: alpha/beta hydrolase [Pseudomonadota bacterium]
MACFVLVHGAWHGGWCWTESARILRNLGHDVHAPTLTGLGERCHQMSAEITPDTHVTDILQVLTWRELSDVILVGHSYGGLVITGVASQRPALMRALVYLDAFVPEVSGKSIFAEANPDRMAGFQRQMDAGAVGLEPDAAMQTWTDDPAIMARLKPLCTPQPKGTLTHGVTLTGLENEVGHRHYIITERNRPSAFWAEYARVKSRPGWTTATFPTWHDAMLEAPEALAHHLHSYAAHLSEAV